MAPSITVQRNGENRQGLKVRRRNQWGARRSYTDARAVNTATRLAFHITVTNPSNFRTNDAHMKAIEAIGIARFSNTGVSYNMIIMPDGSIYEAQPLGRRGAHTVNDKRHSTCRQSGCPSQGHALTAPGWNLNFNTRAIAIAQNVNDPVSIKQIDSAARCAAAWKREKFVSRSARWHGHRCVSAKDCPGGKAWTHMTRLHNLTEQYTVNGLGGGTTPEPEDDMFSEEDRKMLQNLNKVLANNNSALVRYAYDTSKSGSVRFGVEQTWARARQGDLQTRDIGRQVWAGSENPTLEMSYGMILRYILNAVRPDRSQNPGSRIGFLKDLDKISEQQVAILTAVSGGNADEVMARIDEHHAEVVAMAEQSEARLQEVVDINDNLIQGQREILDIVDAAIRDERTAADALRALHDILGGALIEEQPEEAEVEEEEVNDEADR